MPIGVELVSQSTDTIFITNSIRLQPTDKVRDLEFDKKLKSVSLPGVVWKLVYYVEERTALFQRGPSRW